MISCYSCIGKKCSSLCSPIMQLMYVSLNYPLKALSNKYFIKKLFLGIFRIVSDEGETQ